MVSTIVIALGGNAILQADQKGSFQDQMENITRIATQIAQLVRAGHRIVLTHGNGPQVGSLLIQQDEASDHVPAQPLDVLGAMSQGQIGYMLQQALGNSLFPDGVPVVTLITQQIVDPDDEAFDHPTKPVGPFYTAREARRLSVLKGWPMEHIAPHRERGYRRVVPSPRPLRSVEAPAVATLIASGAVVIASGGGGIPVRERDGRLEGIEAVIDKDLSAQQLAEQAGADVLMLMTDIERVKVHYGTDREEDIVSMSIDEARLYMAEGHFPEGTMGPKVSASISFVERSGGVAVISSIETICEAFEGITGTRITK
ncbi:carbamate kinase [archaeon]|nr:MAG: carbamate kinase [archaeon]